MVAYLFLLVAWFALDRLTFRFLPNPVAWVRRWLRADGDPPVSITLTGDGVKFLEAAKPA